MSNSEIREREYLYKLIIGQLYYDGHRQVATNLADEVGLSQEPPAPSDKLFRLVTMAKQFSDEPAQESESNFFKLNIDSMGLDLEYDADVPPSAHEPATYETVFLSTHKAPCRSTNFNTDGSLAAIGSADCSIKIYDIEKIIARELKGDTIPNAENDQIHPVIRCLYDHEGEVSCLAFHPREPILISGSHDKTIKFFDYSKMSVKRSMKSIREAEPIKAFSIHPGGEFLQVAVDHPTLRLYNIETQQCFVSSNPDDQHTRPVVDVCYADNARLFASCALDGDVKIWDGISNRCIQTFMRAHDGAPVRSVKFTRNGKYVLSTGMDCSAKLWELSTNRCIVAYTGAGSSGFGDVSAPACFNHTEDYVLLPDEKSGSLCTWNSRTGERKRLLALGHGAPIRDFVHSKTSPAFITCSDDCKARFWYKKL
uniref:Cleavage stimulation factor 50 kDa subunit n=1 Tax=Panagrolaimus sp. JU765 TaxID=591449 RepID=A0AC34R6A6_9BILA